MIARIDEMWRTWWQRQHWFAEFWSAVTLMMLCVLAARDSAAVGTLPLFHEMSRVMSSNATASLAGLIGTSQIGALWVDSRWLRGVAAAMASCIFALISLSGVASDAAWIGFLGVNLFALIRAFGDAR